MDNYIMIDGKKIPLTDEQVKMLRDTQEDKKSPFERLKCAERYYFIDAKGDVGSTDDFYADADNDLYSVANYCTDKKLMEQRALYETLSRLLWRFSVENSQSANASDLRYELCFEQSEVDLFADTSFAGMSRTIGGCSFSTKALACRAIEEIVTPFIEEHPNFTI